jgi:hypothetical protein
MGAWVGLGDWGLNCRGIDVRLGCIFPCSAKESKVEG